MERGYGPVWDESISCWGGKHRFLHGSLHGTDVFGMQRLDEVGASNGAIHEVYRGSMPCSRR